MKTWRLEVPVKRPRNARSFASRSHRRLVGLACLALVCCAVSWPRRAEAIFGVGDVVVDIQAVIQRMTQFAAAIAQFRAIVRSGQESLEMMRSAYDGLKNWRNLGWIDTLQIVDAPWFDNVEGIDDIRAAVMTTTMSVEGVVNLWADLGAFDKYLSDPRYRKDAWFRSKVNSLIRQSRRARAVRIAVMRQIRQHNKALTADIKRVRRLRDEIQSANEDKVSGKPVDTAKVQALQAELVALEAKTQSEGLMMTNQRILMGLAGDDEAHNEFMRMVQDRRTWSAGSATRLREFGLGFSR
jgi:hypothetical protein